MIMYYIVVGRSSIMIDAYSVASFLPRYRLRNWQLMIIKKATHSDET